MIYRGASLIYHILREEKGLNNLKNEKCFLGLKHLLAAANFSYVSTY